MMVGEITLEAERSVEVVGRWHDNEGSALSAS
jgi:hypothetical protein